METDIEIAIFKEIIKGIEILRGTKLPLHALAPYLDEILEYSYRTSIMPYEFNISDLRAIIGSWGKLPDDEILNLLKEWNSNGKVSKEFEKSHFLNVRSACTIENEENPPRDFDRLMYYFKSRDYQDEIGHPLPCSFFINILKQYCNMPI